MISGINFSEKDFLEARRFTIQMLYGCGDMKYPNEVTINQLLDLTINYLSETVKKAALIFKSESLPATSLSPPTL